MKVAIMQPYIFPYLGYYQLVNAVDKFVFFDDVNFINKGWINRNLIWEKPEAHKFTVPLSAASQNKLIKEIELAEFNKWRDKFLKTIQATYKNAAYFEFGFAWLKEFFGSRNYTHIGELACDSIQAVAELFQLKTAFLNSQNIKYQTGEILTGEDKILSICEQLGADHYINAKNGEKLYNKNRFEKMGIQLSFINMEQIQYRQFDDNIFLPGLSIIDVIMFNSLENTKLLLNRYSLS